MAMRVTPRTLGTARRRTHVARGQALDTSGHTREVPRRSAASALLLVRLGEERGVPADRSLHGTGLALDDLRRPGAEVSDEQELAVVANVVAACPDDDLGLEAGSRYHVTTYGIWGFALASSPTVGSALEVGLRFVDLSYAYCGFSVEQDEREVRLCLDEGPVPEAVRGFVLARDLSALRTVAAEVTGGGLAPARVSVRLPAPPDPARWTAVLGVAPEFDAPQTVVALDPASLDLPLPQADELTAATTEAQCRALLEQRRGRAGTAGQVRDVLAGRPGDLPTVGQVAAQLALSERSLRRRLDAEGTSYRALADEVRETLAEELLRTGGLSVEQVARRLGYAETASFTHAFTRWKGVSPRTWVRRAAP